MLNIEYPDGSIKDISIDAGEFEGTFWPYRTVIEMLGLFYDSNHKEASLKDLRSSFGEKSVSVLVEDQKGNIQLTLSVIKSLWKNENEKGYNPACILKPEKCIPQGMEL